MQSKPHMLTRAWTTPLWRAWGILGIVSTMLACTGIARAGAPQELLGANQLDGYVTRVASAWKPYTTADGRVLDPLDGTDTSDNYGVIMLADVMLKVARHTDDSTLEATGERILRSAMTLPVPNDPFNLLAIATALHDGQSGDFPTKVWGQLAEPLALRAGQIGFPTGNACLITPTCYDNWRLVWSAGAALLLRDNVGGAPGSLAAERAATASQIEADLELALAHAGAPLEVSPAGPGAPKHGTRILPTKLTSFPPGGRARELSDPGAEPSAYELFSAFMLELIGEADPHAITPALARLRHQADRYALEMMAPDGQLSLSGRSLDQSWVQAAGAALGARRAVLEPADADTWHSYSDRAASYLFAAYTINADGLLPIVPGLRVEWNPSIMDGYAALNQYEGLTLWLLSDALANWPRVQAPRTVLPPDRNDLLAADLGSSGLVWGRDAGVWWEINGRATGADPRSAQGIVAVKVKSSSGWRDLLALRPRQGGLSSAWQLRTARGVVATPVFTKLRGTGGRVVLSGFYKQRPNGRPLARATWTLGTTASGVRLRMSMPAKAALHTTVWLPDANSKTLSAQGAQTTRGACVVSASGRACPLTVHWRNQRAGVLELGS